MEMYLQLFAYLILAVSVIAYTILDGFDLGVGALHLFARNDKERRIFLNSIGPLWDGNEVWLIIVGGVLFCAFPPAYAAIFSAFYTPAMLLICGIIFRAVAIEFRSKEPGLNWRYTWDALFSIASIIMIICVGVLLGNCVMGIAIDGEGVYQGITLDFFNAYSILVGIMSLGLFMLHGMIFLLLKTEGNLHNYIRSWMSSILIFFVIFYVIVSLFTFRYAPHMLEMMNRYPVFYLVPVITLISVALVPYFVNRKQDAWAFVFSSLTILTLFASYAIGTFPAILRSTIDPSYSLTFQNASASEPTLIVFSTIVLIGVPLVLGYGFWIYKLFHGKVKLDESSY